MTLTELFPTRIDATLHALRQQAAFPRARVLVSGTAGAFTVTTSIDYSREE